MRLTCKLSALFTLLINALTPFICKFFSSFAAIACYEAKFLSNQRLKTCKSIFINTLAVRNTLCFIQKYNVQGAPFKPKALERLAKEVEYAFTSKCSNYC